MTRADCHADRVRLETPMARAASSGRRYKRGSVAAASLSPIVASPFMPLHVLLPVRSQFCLNRVREISTHEMKIPDAKKFGLCREYPQVYMVGYGCKKFLILWLTGFGEDPGDLTESYSCVKC